MIDLLKKEGKGDLKIAQLLVEKENDLEDLNELLNMQTQEINDLKLDIKLLKKKN